MHQQVLAFWFEQVDPAQWWQKDDEFDQLIIRQFSLLHQQAIQCELCEWRITPQGRLAEVIVLDQFSRNMFRGLPESFAYDSLALALSQEAIAAGDDVQLTPMERTFLYMPFMHSESLAIHNIAIDLFKNNGIESNINFEISHKKIIEKFGRYPHRNDILGRQSTAKEKAFLSQPNSSF